MQIEPLIVRRPTVFWIHTNTIDKCQETGGTENLCYFRGVMAKVWCFGELLAAIVVDFTVRKLSSICVAAKGYSLSQGQWYMGRIP